MRATTPLIATWAMTLAAAVLAATQAPAADPWVRYEGGDGPGKGKQVVLDLRRRGVPFRGIPASIGQDSRQTPRLHLHRAVRHQPRRRLDRPRQPAQHPRPEGAARRPT